MSASTGPSQYTLDIREKTEEQRKQREKDAEVARLQREKDEYELLNTFPESLNEDELLEWSRLNAKLIIKLSENKNINSIDTRSENGEKQLNTELIGLGLNRYPSTYKNELLSTIYKVRKNRDFKEKIHEISIDTTRLPQEADPGILHEHNILQVVEVIAQNKVLSVFDFVGQKSSEIADDVCGGHGQPGQSVTIEEQKNQIREAITDGTPIALSNLELTLTQDIERNDFEYVELIPYSDQVPSSPIFQVKDSIMNFVSIQEANNYSSRDGIISPVNIPYYFVIVIGGVRAFHLSVLLLLGDQLYSLGLGYQGEHKGPKLDVGDKLGTRESFHFGGVSALYTPDFLVKLEKQNRIVDFGILRLGDVLKLNDFISQASGLTSKCSKTGNNTETSEKEFKITTNSLLLPKCVSQYATLSYPNPEAVNTNCTSFVSRVFPHIDCQIKILGIKTGPVLPSKCNTTPPFKEVIFNRWYELYTGQPESGGDILQLLRNTETPERREIVSQYLPPPQTSETYSQSVSGLPGGGSKLKTKKSTFRKSTFRKSTFRKSGAKYRKTQKRRKSTFRKSTFRKSGAKHRK